MNFFFATLVLSSSALACDQDGAEEAKGLLDAVAAVIKEAPAIAFESEVRLGIGTLEIAQKAKAILKRPNLARLEIAGAGQDALLVLDGASMWHHIKAGNGFFKSKQLGTIKLEQYGVGPLAPLFFEKGTGTLLPYLSGAAVTKERFGEEECSVVAWKVGAEETRLWITGNRLRRYRTTRTLGEQVFVQTFTYGELDPAPHIAEDTFAFTPPEGAHPLDAGDESGFLEPGADAPDFAATGLDGKAIRLSDFEGKPVLLTFWFYG